MKEQKKNPMLVVVPKVTQTKYILLNLGNQKKWDVTSRKKMYDIYFSFLFPPAPSSPLSLE